MEILVDVISSQRKRANCGDPGKKNVGSVRNEQYRSSFCQTQKDKVRKIQSFLRILRIWPRGDKHGFDSIQTSFLSFLVIFFRSGIGVVSK